MLPGNKKQQAIDYAQDLKDALADLRLMPGELEVRQSEGEGGVWSVGIALKKERQAIEPFLKIGRSHDEANAAAEEIKRVIGII